MSKAFPTKKELGIIHKRWAIGLTFVTFIIWSLTYFYGKIFIYGYICPLIFIAAIWQSYQTVLNTKSVSGYILLILSSIFFLISLGPWFLPIARISE